MKPVHYHIFSDRVEHDTPGTSQEATGLSIASVPDLVTKAKAQKLLGDKFDEAKFDAASTIDEDLAMPVVAKARFLKLAGVLGV